MVQVREQLHKSRGVGTVKVVTLVLLVLALLTAPAMAWPQHEGKHGHDHEGKHGHGRDPKVGPPTDRPMPPSPGDRLDPNASVPEFGSSWGIVRRARPTQLVFGPWYRPAPECSNYVRRFPTIYVCVRAAW